MMARQVIIGCMCVVLALVIAGCGRKERDSALSDQAGGDWHSDVGPFLAQTAKIIDKINPATSTDMSAGQLAAIQGESELMKKFGLGREHIQWRLPFKRVREQNKDGSFALEFDLTQRSESPDRIKLIFCTTQPDVWRSHANGEIVNVRGTVMSYGTFTVSGGSEAQGNAHSQVLALFVIKDCMPQEKSSVAQ